MISAGLCAAIYMLIGPAPVRKIVESDPQKRTLAYQEKIAAAAEETKQTVAAAPEVPPAPAVPEAYDPAAAPAEEAQSALPSETEAPASPEEQEMAALPQEEGNDPNALPWQHPEAQGAPSEAEADAPMPPPPGADDGSSYPSAALPADADPNAAADEEPQEWVQVLVSGTGMRATASEDEPILFAFPYGRVLRVVSHYGDWVEVTDPQSAATGWMQAHLLAPSPPPGARQEISYGEEPQEHRGGFFRRLFGGSR